MKKESVSKKVESPKNERDIQTEKILVENFYRTSILNQRICEF